MNFLPLILFGLLGLVITWLLIPWIQQRSAAAVAKAVRTQAFHHTHRGPVSRLGGVALAAAFIVVAVIVLLSFPAESARAKTRLVIVGGSLAMFGLGLWDDLRPLGARKKLLGQVLIASLVALCGVQIEKFQNPLTGEVYNLGIWSWWATIFWLVALTNVINLVDGIDGLAGGIALMLMGLLTFVGLRGDWVFAASCAAGLFGALLGFLRYNFPPATIYMGDGGAYFLGFLIAILTLTSSQKGAVVAALIAPLFALALPISDVSLAILRRGLKGLPVFRPDRDHIHHRLLKFGLSRTRTVLVMYGLSSVFLVMAFAVLWLGGRELPILLGFVCLTLLLAARMFDFSRHWLTVGWGWENSLELRRETNYALALGRWLELEAERVASIESLWNEFSFIASKLGFARVALTLEGGERVWESAHCNTAEGRAWRVHDLGSDYLMTLRFEARADMSPRLLEHLSELAAEAWLGAVTRWRQTTGRLPRFDA